MAWWWEYMLKHGGREVFTTRLRPSRDGHVGVVEQVAAVATMHLQSRIAQSIKLLSYTMHSHTRTHNYCAGTPGAPRWGEQHQYTSQ